MLLKRGLFAGDLFSGDLFGNAAEAVVAAITGGKRRPRIIHLPGYVAPTPRPPAPVEDDEALLLCGIL